MGAQCNAAHPVKSPAVLTFTEPALLVLLALLPVSVWIAWRRLATRMRPDPRSGVAALRLEGHALTGVIVRGALIGLLLSVYVKQLENFAGTMNFVIFPMFFISSALYPLWKLRESGAEIVWHIARWNPFTHAVELIRYALYGRFEPLACTVVLGSAALFFIAATLGYDPQRGLLKRSGRPG